MVGGTREVVKPAALGPSDHLPVANACAVAKDNFWRKEGCLQRASDNADKGVALPVRNRRRWERNGWCSGVILAQRSLDFLGSSDPPAPASRVAETTGTETTHSDLRNWSGLKGFLALQHFERSRWKDC
ncbi:uncharacterized protein [Symphalangus syndactylus]|uniref:uncharacterized protein isoform X4 n=1 Tax=Symphalangus syndactylus TaxID=9590 RepID=UPI003003DEB9